MNIEEARCRAKELFGELALPPDKVLLTEVGRREGQGLGLFEQLSSMTPPGFPLPELLHFGFTRLLDLDPYGPEEKLLWGICFAYRGATFGFEVRKFGLRLLCEPSNLDSSLLREVQGKARQLTDIVEKYLKKEVASQQIMANRFTVKNLYHQLDERYRFLRKRASEAYANPPPEPEVVQTKHGTMTRSDDGRPAREGGALGTAAVDSYFSLQEHLFCLVSAFALEPPPTGGFLEFIGSRWTNKAKILLDMTDSATKNIYDQLLNIREEWRNPLTHGGFLSGGGSLHFHVPGIGALPARLRRTPRGVRLGFRLQNSSFVELMEFLDSVDAFLRSGPLRLPIEWAESGLDVAFDDASRAAYRAAMSSGANFRSFIEYNEYQYDLHANMDF